MNMKNERHKTKSNWSWVLSLGSWVYFYKVILALFVSGLFCSVPGAGQPRLAQATNDPHLLAGERAKAIKLLLDSQKEFLDTVENLSDEQWTYKPAPDRWSVAEVAEHIMLAEGALFSTVEAALAEKLNPDWEAKTAGKTEMLARALLNRQRKAQAAEQVQPSGKLTRVEIIDRFKEARAKTLKFIKETNLPLKAHTLDHPFPIFNTLNAYQWLIYIPLHNMRQSQKVVSRK